MRDHEFDQYRQQLGYNTQVSDQLDNIWLKIKPYKDDCCFIYAGLNADYTISHRSDEHVMIQIKDAVLAGKHNILFDCSTEGLDERIIVRLNSLANTAKKLFTDVEFFLITGASDGEDAHIKACEYLQITPTLHIISCRFFESVTKKQYLRGVEPTEYSVNIRPKTYVCLNKVHRSHRVRLLESLLAENLINDDCYYSFHDLHSPCKDDIMKDPAVSTGIARGQLPNIQQNIEFIKTLRLNFDETRTNPVDLIPADVPLFNDTYFSIVTETIYYDCTEPNHKLGSNLPFLNCIFFSEKVYKPIAMMQPFLLVSRPHSIKMLKEHGFKTFHPYIDESYDSIEDDDIRMQTIVNEVKRLSKQTTEEWVEWCTNVKSIVEYNQKHLRENTDYIEDKDLSMLARNN